MAYYEQRLEHDLAKLKTALDDIADKVEVALNDAVDALLSGNETLAYETVIGDRLINRLVTKLDNDCLGFIALHLPAAGHLRFIASTMRIAILLERIGDYSSTICREAVQLPQPPEGVLAQVVASLAHDARHALQQAIVAFRTSDLELAHTTMRLASETERTFDQAIVALTKDEALERKSLLNLLLALSQLVRVASQAKNMCEETVFINTGQSKPAKQYNILYIDEENSCFSQMAEALTRKKFSGYGIFTSAGRTPAGKLDPGMVTFLEGKGVSMANAQPKPLDSLAYQTGEYNLVISLQGPVKSYMEQVPFHSIALEWDPGLPPKATQDDSGNDIQRMEDMYRTIGILVTELMEKLFGDDLVISEG